MKTRCTFFVFILLFISLSGLNAQPWNNEDPIIPLQQNRSVLFGKDIVINDQPTQIQQKVAMCSSFNGWQYVVIAYTDPTLGGGARLSILKSIDNGLTWTTILDGFFGGSGSVFSSVDILVIGDSVENLKILLSFVSTSNPLLIGTGLVGIYDEETGAWEQNLFSVGFCYDISLATDLLHPSVNSNPYSVGILYSQYYDTGDSLIFKSSSNGGFTFDGYQGVATTTRHFHKVSLAYGRSPSWSSGRYFAAWEEQDDFGLMPGNIYTSHTDPNFNSPFTTPVNLDGLDPSSENLCQNPSIACQYNNVNNDSSNLTEVVLFEKYNLTNQRSDIRGYYNLQATNHSKFKKLNISDSLHNNLQPDISFNPYDSTFMVTYFDSTQKKLPFLTSDMNIQSPDNWTIVSSGYNDSPDITSPGPKVEINQGEPEAMNAWIADRSNGKGIAMFDSPSSTWTGISEINKTTEARLISAYPNPCSNEVKIAFETKKTGNVSIDLFTILGQPLGTITDQSYSVGRNMVKYNVSDLPEGTYIYNFKSGDFTASGKVTVIR
jgi:hypothetical protein